MNDSVKPLREIKLPRSTCAGIGWPAIPSSNGAKIIALLHQLEESQWWPAQTISQMQFAQLKVLVGHAEHTVPFYRERLSVLEKAKDRELTPDDFARVPILKRGEIQAAGEDLDSEIVPKSHGRVGTISTSGSTGRPITVKGTEVNSLFFGALNLRSHRWHDRQFSASLGIIRNLSGKLAKYKDNDKGGGWVPGYRAGRSYFFDITRPVSEQLDWLVKRNPDYLITFPSNLRALLSHSRESGIVPGKLRQIATMSETLDPAVREECRRIWNTEITDAYSSEELGIIAIQCPKNEHYHVQSESLLVEVVDDDGVACAPGQIGRLVVTDLHNFATPLIRYELGDYAEVGEPCSCGRGLPVLNRIAGRTRNMLTLPTGDKIWPSFPEDQMMPIAPIRQFQVVQHDLQRVEARLVPGRTLTDDEIAGMRSFLAGCLRYDCDLELVFVDEIARAPNGKYEDFVSHVGN